MSKIVQVPKFLGLDYNRTNNRVMIESENDELYNYMCLDEFKRCKLPDNYMLPKICDMKGSNKKSYRHPVGEHEIKKFAMCDEYEKVSYLKLLIIGDKLNMFMVYAEVLQWIVDNSKDWEYTGPSHKEKSNLNEGNNKIEEYIKEAKNYFLWSTIGVDHKLLALGDIIEHLDEIFPNRKIYIPYKFYKKANNIDRRFNLKP